MWTTPGSAATWASELRTDGGTERIPVPTADSYLLELEDFARAVAGEAQPLLGREDAVGQARLAALRRSAADAFRSGLSFEVSATRKSEPFTRWSAWSWSFDQRGSGTPEMYQLEPLSATIIP